MAAQDRPRHVFRSRLLGFAYVARQVKFDSDLWVLEFESPDLLPPFEGTIV